MKSLLFNEVTAARERLANLTSASAGAIAVVPAAGVGERSGLSIPKQYAPLAGQIMLARSVNALLRSSQVGAVVVVLSPKDTHWQALKLDEALGHDPRVVAVKLGGASRRDSVLNGLTLLQEAKVSPKHWVMVHDAARPGLTVESVTRLCEAAQRAVDQGDAGAILALPVADTLKREQSGNTVSQTVQRQGMWAAQTPQMFQLQSLAQALSQCQDATDEASAIEASGGRVALVPGEMRNFKVTQPQDFELMEALMSATEMKSPSSRMPFAVGQGFDVHALVEGRPLILGGVRIPYEKGLAGHSDADVLLHAITDAILGAAGLGDIGRHFPDTDTAYQGANSAKLLEVAVKRVQDKGWRVAQIDATIVAQAPKISPFAPEMQRVIAQCCGLMPELVNIKGKTTEGLGFTGRGEGIAAQAVAMLARQSD